MSLSIVLLIIGMGIVTYLPRVLPLTVLEGKSLPPFVQGVLRNIPYAVLGALIFPGILLIQEGNLLMGVIGAAAAFLLAYLGANVVVVVLGSIAVLSGYILLFL